MGRKERKRKRSKSQGWQESAERVKPEMVQKSTKKTNRKQSDVRHEEGSDVREGQDSAHSSKKRDSSRRRGQSDAREQDAERMEEVPTPIQKSGKKKRKSKGRSVPEEGTKKKSPIEGDPLWMKRMLLLARGSPYVTIPREESCLLLLRYPTQLVLQGYCAMTVRHGEVEVMGFDTTGWADRRLELWSPTCNSLLTLRTVSGATLQDMDEAALKDLLGEQFEKESLTDIMDVPLVLLVCEKIDSPKMDFITSLPMYEDLLSPAAQRTECDKDLAPYRVSVATPEDSSLPPLSVLEEVRQVLEKVHRACADGKNPVIMVCGGKNTGKSTLNRFLLNSILKSASRVYYLECDIGQTEFTPPGCLSLQEVTQPLLGPPFSHQLKSKRMCFFGAVSPADDAMGYVDCLKFTLEKFHSLESPGPLVVNTMGWNEGLGLLLLVDTVHLTQPDILLQLQSGNRHRNFKAFNHDTVSQEYGLTFNTHTMQFEESSEPSEIKPYEFHLVNSATATENLSCFKLRPGDHRNLALLSHLCEGLPPLTPPTALAFHSFAWDRLALHVCHDAVATPLLLSIFTASVVALCHVDLSTATRQAENLPYTFEDLPVCECLGLGLVTGIDEDKGVMHVVTPLSAKDLDQVTLLMKGAVAVPDQLFLQQKCSRAPFTDFPVAAVGSSAIRSRNRMPRRPPRTPQT